MAYSINNGTDQSRRMHALALAMPKWVDLGALNDIYEEAARLRRCGKDVHVDHRIPLQHPEVCGLHVPWNLAIIWAEENIRKGNTFDSLDYVPRDETPPKTDSYGRPSDWLKFCPHGKKKNRVAKSGEEYCSTCPDCWSAYSARRKAAIAEISGATEAAYQRGWDAGRRHEIALAIQESKVDADVAKANARLARKLKLRGL